LNVQAAGIKVDKSGKIICTNEDKTSVDNIFAIGDVVLGRPELTPVAIKCGQLLGERLFNGK
jgi:thioredoxin reductase (NADPH)